MTINVGAVFGREIFYIILNSAMVNRLKVERKGVMSSRSRWDIIDCRLSYEAKKSVKCFAISTGTDS